MLCRTHSYSLLSRTHHTLKFTCTPLTLTLTITLTLTLTFALCVQTNTITAPSSFIVKLSPLSFGSRVIGRLCFLKTEVEFYTKNLLGRCGIPTPACYFANYDKLSGESVLFLEDLSSAWYSISQDEAWTLPQAKHVISTVAKQHAHYWGAEQRLLSDFPELSEIPSCLDPMTLDVTFDMAMQNIDDYVPKVKEILDVELSDTMKEFMLGLLKPMMRACADTGYFAMGRPLTLV